MFILKRETEMPYFNGKGLYYVHDKTGMEVFHVRNSSSELSAAFMFATPSEDGTGIAHILEHTVLSGSGRYPVKDPFMEVSKSSPSTFMNAMTFCDKTVYPFASPLKKDFDILFDIYADAVFNPLLRRESFEQEGVRFYGGKIDGVVFNEMLGSRASEDDAVSFYTVNRLFRGTPYEYDSGGDPESIVDLTYEEYLARYRKWYSPANCRLFLFGDLDAAEYMKRLERLYLGEENASKWSGLRFVNASAPYLPEKILSQSSEFGIKRGGFYRAVRDKHFCASKDANTVFLTFLTTPADDPFMNLSMSMLSSLLLGHPGAPLQKAILESSLGRDLCNESGISAEYPVVAFGAGFVGAREGAEDEIESFLSETLQRISETGFSREEIEGVIRRKEFRIREIKGRGYPYGISTAITAARYWLRGTSPECALDREGLLNRVKEEVAKGRYFENLLRERIVENPFRCLLTVKGDPCFDECLNRRLDAKREARERDFEKKNFDAMEERFNRFVNTPDSASDLEKIPRIRLSDLPLNTGIHLDAEKIVKNGIPVYVKAYESHRITYLKLSFDCTGLSLEEKLLLPILEEFMSVCSTSKRSFVEVGRLKKKLFGALSFFRKSSIRADGSHVSIFVLKCKILNEDLERALPLVGEILTEAVFSDEKRLRQVLSGIITDIEANYLYDGHFFSILESASHLNPASYEDNLLNGTGYLFHVRKLYRDIDKVKDRLIDRLDALRRKVITRSRMTTFLVTDGEEIPHVAERLASFVGTLPDADYSDDFSFYEKYDSEKESGPRKTVFKVGTGPAYNSISFSLDGFGLEDMNYARVFFDILRNDFLIDAVRGKGGAYGAMNLVNWLSRSVSFASYRDPSVDSTFRVFREALDYVPTEEGLEHVKIDMMGGRLKPLVPSSVADRSFAHLVTRRTDEDSLRNRRIIESCTLDDLERIRGRIIKGFNQGSICSICSATGDSEYLKGATTIEVGL